MKIQEPSEAQQPRPLWRLAFRAGFLFAASFAVLAIGRWMSWIEAPQLWSSSLSAHWWHAHEMVFGFAMPVVAGFLLSAVATWTGIPGTKGLRLQLLFGSWLAARLILWFIPEYAWFAWAFEVLFLALLMFELGQRVWARKQWRNAQFQPVILILTALSTASFYYRDNGLMTTQLHYGAVWMIAVFVVIIGGRVMPMFTSNGAGIRITPHKAWVEPVAILATVIVGLLSIINWGQHPVLGYQLLCFLTGALHLYRMARWQGWKTFSVPLLWSMHLSYLCIPLTLFGLAAAGDNPIAVKNLIHLLAIGTIGGMILSMMSRVSLGHTGRPLQVPTYIAVAFAMIFIAALLRALLPIIAIELTPWAWRLSAALWMLAFACFLWRYTPILTRPRADGKPG